MGFQNNIYTKMHRCTARNEFRSWENSLEYMYKVLNDQDISNDAGVAIEYNIPQTSKRVDFLISGYDSKNKENVIIIELKQWTELQSIDGREALVETYTGNALRKVVHPSYQAWSYAAYIEDFAPVGNKTGGARGITCDVALVEGDNPFILTFMANEADVPVTDDFIRHLGRDIFKEIRDGIRIY